MKTVELKENEIVVKKEQLQQLLYVNKRHLAEKQELLQERKELYNGCIKIFEVIGLAENGKLKISGEVTIKQIIGGAKPTLMLLINSTWSSTAEEKIKQKFSFLKELFPLFQKIDSEIKNQQ